MIFKIGYAQECFAKPIVCIQITNYSIRTIFWTIWSKLTILHGVATALRFGKVEFRNCKSKCR